MIVNIMIVGNILAFLVIALIIFYRQRQRMVGRLTPREMVQKNQVLNHKYFTWLNPYYVEDRAKKATWDFNFKKYWGIVMLGVAISLLFIFLVLRMYYLFPLGILGGFALPNVLVFLHHRKKQDEIFSETSAYINTCANLTMTYGDPYRALIDITEKGFIEEPLLNDLKLVVRRIENGVSMEEAFRYFNEKYNNQFLDVFHDNLVLHDKYGGKMNDVLMQVAKDYDKALARRIMFRNEKYPQRQSFYTLLKILIAFPFILLGLSYEYYASFVDSSTGKIIFLILITIGIISSIKIEFKYEKDDVFSKKA